MTGEKDAPAEMPGVEEIALFILQALDTARSGVYPDEASTARLEPHIEKMKARYGELRGRSFSAAYQSSRVEFIRDTIAALFAPILAEKERQLRVVQNAAKTIASAQGTELEHLRQNARFDHALRQEVESLRQHNSEMTDALLAAEAALAKERERAAKAAFLALEGMRDEGENDIRIAQSRVDAAIRAEGE